MNTIIRFAIDPSVESLFAGIYRTADVVNAVQAELNAGNVTKTSTKANGEYALRKAADGSKVSVIVMKTATKESLECKDTVPVRFANWSRSAGILASFAPDTEFSLPSTFKVWLDKFAKMTPEEVKAWQAEQEKLAKEKQANNPTSNSH
jgi:hypothetical protein